MLETAGLSSLLGVFAFFAVWESGNPRLPFVDPADRRRHIARNVGLLAVFVILTQALSSLIAPYIGAFLPEPSRGLLAGSALNVAAQILIGVIALDLAEYLWHRYCHHNRWLWRLHRVHHADGHLDVSTGMRFHPLESLLGLGLRLALLLLLGLPLWIEGVRILASNPLALAQHANVSFPVWFERGARWLIVTPGLHRVHHSLDPADHDHNYGQVFPWWDRLFGSYRAPAGPVQAGLQGFEEQRFQTLTGMLASPWFSAPAGGRTS